jgi:GTP pyrophosphokinase
VEVLTSKKPNPSRDWLNPNLNYIHSSRARAKVQHFFKLQDRDKHLAQGKELLDAELIKLTYLTINQNELKEAALRFNVKTVDDLYAAIGSGNARLQQVINYFKQLEGKLKPAPELDPQSLVRDSHVNKSSSGDNNGITVSGVGNLLTHMAKCCSPVPGDTISGFITQGRGISVHRQDCEQLANALKLQAERLVEVQWGLEDKQSYQASTLIIASDRQGLFRDISTIIANEKVSIIGIESHSDNAKQTMSMKIKMEVTSSELLTRVLEKLHQLDDVIEVKRL